MASLKCKACGAPLIFNGTEYICSLCASTFKPTEFFKKEETVEEFIEEPPIVDVEEEETLIFTCPKCTPSTCPTCGIKIKYIATIKEEEVPHEEVLVKKEVPQEQEIKEVQEPQKEESKEKPEEINIEIEEKWPEHDSDYSSLEKLHDKNVKSIKRTICYGDHYYLVTYMDDKEDTLSAKGMRLKGLMTRK